MQGSSVDRAFAGNWTRQEANHRDTEIEPKNEIRSLSVLKFGMAKAVSSASLMRDPMLRPS